MTDQQAKEILLLYRPDSPDAGQPEFAEALAQVRRSPELLAWFDAHCALQKSVCAQFQQIPVPAGLKEQILSERKAHAGFWPKTPAALAVSLAALLVIGCLAVQWLQPYLNRPAEDDLEFYRQQMVSSVLRAYSMDLETNNLAAVRSFLTDRQADADWELPPGMAHATVTGCGVLGWQDKKVSMICFHSGKPLAEGHKTDLFLFVVDRKTIRHAPASGEPEVAQVNRLVTASWSKGDKTYVLAAEGDPAFLKKFL